MKFLKIVLFLILGFNTSAQIELFQLQWATDSSYVIGALPSGEPVWVHVDSLGLADSIYLQGDSLIVLKKGSGQVYRARIWDENDYSSRYDIPNPQLNDLYGDGQKLYYWDGDSWELLDRDGEIGNEGLLGLQQIATNIIGLTSSSNGFDIKHIVGINGIQISTNELDTINIGIDTTLFEAGETQYLNPYVIGGDTSGFYLTIAQDTVLFVATADTTAGTVDIVTGTSPIIITGDATHTPNVTIQNATTSQSGALTSTDWNIFNGKVGGSGVATRLAFWSGTSSLSSNANLYWDNTNSRLGIGTSSPSKQLTTTQDVSVNGLDIGLGLGNVITNVRVGSNALNNNTTGSGNIAIGSQSLFTNTTGINNISNGYQSLYYNTTGSNNVALGAQSLLFNTTGGSNIASGSQALFNNTTGSNNAALGFSSLFSNSTGNNNVGNGAQSLYYNTTGSNNVANGYWSLLFNTTGSNNVADGMTAMQTNTTGSNNVALGFSSLFSNSTGNNNVALGLYAGYSETGSNKLYIENSSSSTPLIGGDFSTDKVGINTAIGSIARTLHVTGEVKITDLITDPPTKIVGADADGDLGAITKGYGLSFATDTLKADTTSANGLATQYDLTQVSGGSSKTIDILGSDFTTSATSLQTTDLAYTFPSTGTYEVKLYGTYTSSNTANGISFGYVESGGLTASFVTGSHYVYDRSISASGSTMAIRGVSALGHVIATSSVVTANSPLTIMSEILVTVSATGTLTFNFASESGSYSATLVAGSSLIVEKLN